MNQQQQQHYIDGDTRLEHVPAARIADQFVSRLGGWLDGRYLLTVPPFSTFFTDQNVEYICHQIARVLEKLFPGEKFHVPANNELADAMVDVAVHNCGLAGGNRMELHFLNRSVIESESRVQFASMRGMLRYFKEILADDRPKTMPYGVATDCHRGEVTYSATDYALSHPWSNRRREYMHDALGMCSSRDLSGHVDYKRMRYFLLPTVPRK